MRGGKDGQMVTLTKEQRKMLTRLETGLDFWELPEAEQERVLYLDSLGLSRAREDHGPGRWELTEEGRAALQALRDIEDEIQKEEQRKDHEARQADAAEAKEAKDRATEHQFQIKLTILQAVLSFGLGLASGLLLGNADRIAMVVKHWIQLLWG